MNYKKKTLLIISINLLLITVITLVVKFSFTTSSMKFTAQYIESDTLTEELGLQLKIPSHNKDFQYVEGQAIIITNPTVSVYSAKSRRSSILGEIDIEELAALEPNNSVNILSSNNMQNRNYLKISLVTSDKHTTKDLIEKLEDEGIYAEPNYILHTMDISNDTYLSSQWAIENKGQNGGTEGMDINPISTTSNEEKVIAVVDTGVDYTHEDLKNIMWENPYSNSTDLPGQHGYDFGDNDTEPIDISGHGTHCAGIIAAQSNNNIGVTGAVLEDSNIKIMALKMEDSEGNMTVVDAIEAYNYINTAIEKGVNVVAINNSWGEYFENKEYLQSLELLINQVGEKGALSICAAANDSFNNDNTNEKVLLPATFDSEYIISVASSNVSDELSDFSNYGKTTVDLAAPGSEILSTVPYNVYNPSIYTEQKRSELSSLYEDFEGSYNDIKIIGGSVLKSSSTYFGEKGGNSLQWNLEFVESELNYSYILALPLETTSAEQYLSAMIRTSAEKTTEIKNADGTTTVCSGICGLMYYAENFDDFEELDSSLIKEQYAALYNKGNSTQWKHIFSKVNQSGNGTLCIIYIPKVVGRHTIYIDDYAISKPSVSPNQFGKYEFYDGTSMAAPFVTATVGIANNKYENELKQESNKALYIKRQILQAVRPSSNLTSKVLTGGTLDISKLPRNSSTIPTLNLPTNVNDATWSNINTIPIQNTVEGCSYEFTTNGRISWQDCINNNVVLTEGDKVYEIIVREKDSDKMSDTYIYKLDTTKPDIAISPEKDETEKFEIKAKATVSDKTSGIKNTNIEYVFSTNTTAPDGNTQYQTANLTNGEAIITSPENAEGTYYVYIKPIEDNATNKSSTEVHKFGPYKLKAPIRVIEVQLNKSKITMHQGQKDNTLAATINPSDATNPRISWTSSNPEVATVQDGEITAISVGTTIITVTTEDGEKTANCNVTVVNPCLNLPTDQDSATWVKPADVNNINETIELINTIEGNEYEYSLDGGSNWLDCEYNNSDKKWSFNITEEGINKIKVRLKDSTVTSDEYFLKLDASKPMLNINGELNNPEIIEVIVIDSYSGLANNYIEYIFSDTEPTKETVWNKADLYNDGKAILILPNTNGTFNIYIKPISDNVGLQTIEDEFHMFEEYSFNDINPVTRITLDKENMIMSPGKTDNLLATLLPQEASNKNILWTSSNPEIATVSKDGTVLAISKGETTIKATTISGGYTAECKVKVIVPIQGLTLTKQSETLTVGEDMTLQTVITPTDANIKSTQWISSNQEVAKVENGLVTAISEGTANITAKVTDEEGKTLTATCIITVKKYVPPVVKISNITLNKEKMTLKQGNTEKLLATILPENVTNKDVTWMSSNTSVATVSKDGTVTAINKGTTIITVSNQDGTIKDTCEVTVIIPIIDVTIPDTASVEEENTISLIAIINPSEASISKIEWVSEDNTIAEVNSNGVVRGIKKGKVKIAVRVTDIQGTQKTDICEVTVTEKISNTYIPVTKISLGNTTLKLNTKTTQKIGLVITPQNADIESIKWSSSNPKIATVDSEGIVKALKVGQTDITVIVKDKSGNVKTETCKVTVKKVEKENETTTKPAKKEDLTTSKQELPKTGIKGLIIAIIIMVFVLTISFNRYRSLRDVK